MVSAGPVKRTREEGRMAFDSLEALMQGDQSEAAQRSALKRRAIALLARRDHSRAELARKLLTPPQPRRQRGGQAGRIRDAFSRDAFSEGTEEGGVRAAAPERRPPSPALVESVLDELESLGFLSDQRMAESLVRNNAGRFGRARLSQDLQRKGLDESLIGEVLAPLADDERSRAQAAWERRFGKPPANMKERARQYRFLMGRGFGASIVSAVVPRVQGASDGEDDDGFPAGDDAGL